MKTGAQREALRCSHDTSDTHALLSSPFLLFSYLGVTVSKWVELDLLPIQLLVVLVVLVMRLATINAVSFLPSFYCLLNEKEIHSLTLRGVIICHIILLSELAEPSHHFTFTVSFPFTYVFLLQCITFVKYFFCKNFA